MKTLFDEIRMGDLTLKNRIVMAPLTRSRAGTERQPNDLMKEYYAQRAGAGFILTEATAVTPMGVGYADTPGIWSKEQVLGWKKITAAVQERGSRIFLQLWHVGRISDPMFLNGELPVAPSAIAAEGHVSLVRPQRQFVTPRALSTAEVKLAIEQYRKAAENAKCAGFDGVEIHGANGYLVDQFLQSGSNQRTDQYGGPIENRARFALEVVDAILTLWPADRVGFHLSPRSDSNSMSDGNPRETFTYLARELGKRKLAFLFIRERQGENYLTPELKKEFGGLVIANQGLNAELAQDLLDRNQADLVSFGSLYISNPDLAERLKIKAPLTPPNSSTFYTAGARGYTDYPKINS
ncbi:MAG: alkene reductase [Bdellovibrio sp.]|jgi:2,4-dienoyl-CoA reductase-like NADH-dependent reductase (Old Yellow Enzyme family)